MTRARFLLLTFLLVTVLYGGLSCSLPEPVGAQTPPRDFLVLHESVPEPWGSWTVYVIQHKPTGMCFVTLNPGGDGGGNISSADQRVCGYYARTER